MKKRFGFVVSVSLVAIASIALAEELHSGLMERWYGALAAVEREEIAALLSQDATLDLQDIGVTQTGAEFVASLDEWADAIKGGSIRHKIDSDGTDTVSVTVCYTFAESAMMTKESFVFAGRQIVSSVQKTVAENCDGF
ncbi:MAG: nuclear transport factor 2 family protein [Notoacmeibacter sp.]